MHYQKPINLKTIRDYVEGIDRVTLFRILSLFESKKIIHKIVLENGLIYFAICNEKCSSDLDALTRMYTFCVMCVKMFHV